MALSNNATYRDMIQAALLNMNCCSGASLDQIKTFIITNYPVKRGYANWVNVMLRQMVKKGEVKKLYADHYYLAKLPHNRSEKIYVVTEPVRYTRSSRVRTLLKLKGTTPRTGKKVVKGKKKAYRKIVRSAGTRKMRYSAKRQTSAKKRTSVKRRTALKRRTPVKSYRKRQPSPKRTKKSAGRRSASKKVVYRRTKPATRSAARVARRKIAKVQFWTESVTVNYEHSEHYMCGMLFVCEWVGCLWKWNFDEQSKL